MPHGVPFDSQSNSTVSEHLNMFSLVASLAAAVGQCLWGIAAVSQCLYSMHWVYSMSVTWSIWSQRPWLLVIAGGFYSKGGLASVHFCT